MVHHHRKRSSDSIKDEESLIHLMDCSASVYYKRTKPKLLSFLFLITFLSCCYVLAPFFLGPSFSLSLLYSNGPENDANQDGVDVKASACSSVSTGTICCDRTGYRSDICVMKGDIRTDSSSSSIFLYNSINKNNGRKGETIEEDQVLQQEKIKPYTRKWETSVMDTIDELNLVSKRVNSGNVRKCDVQHDVPAVFFSNGGYTGNVYHEFNDGIIPLYITSQRFNKKVVFVILEYHSWWIMKYGDILSHLSEFPSIDFSQDNRTHCFSEAIVGLKIHDELAVDSSLMEGNKSIVDFRNLMDKAYSPRIKGLIREEEMEAQEKSKQQQQRQISLSPSSRSESETSPGVQEIARPKPKLVIVSRSGSRAITNENLLVKMAEEIGFHVAVLKPQKTSELAKIYRVLNESDVMIGVHGAAMTHFMFMKPKSVFIQVVPLGTNWAADTYYGEPARKLGLKYIGYEIHPKESSLYDRYDRNDPILSDPDSITNKGWEYTKKIYLDSQNVKLDLRRFRKRLHRAYEYTVLRLNLNLQHQSQ